MQTVRDIVIDEIKRGYVPTLQALLLLGMPEGEFGKYSRDGLDWVIDKLEISEDRRFDTNGGMCPSEHEITEFDDMVEIYLYVDSQVAVAMQSGPSDAAEFHVLRWCSKCQNFFIEIIDNY